MIAISKVSDAAYFALVVLNLNFACAFAKVVEGAIYWLVVTIKIMFSTLLDDCVMRWLQATVKFAYDGGQEIVDALV